MDCCILGLGCFFLGGWTDCLGTQGLEVAMGARESAVGRASLWGFKLACSYLFSPPLHPRDSFLLLCWQKKVEQTLRILSGNRREEEKVPRRHFENYIPHTSLVGSETSPNVTCMNPQGKEGMHSPEMGFSLISELLCKEERQGALCWGLLFPSFILSAPFNSKGI